MKNDVSSSKLKLNLQKYNCVSFRLTTETIIEDAILNSFKIKGTPLSERHFSSFPDEYYRSKKLHSIILRILKQKEDSRTYAIRLYYEIIEPDHNTIPPLAKKPGITPFKLFEAICNSGRKMFIRCDCVFSYMRSDNTIAFSLPLAIKGNELYDEVRGIRFVKLRDENILWENYVNLIDKNTIHHRVKFAREMECNLEMPLNLLSFSSDISKRS